MKFNETKISTNDWELQTQGQTLSPSAPFARSDFVQKWFSNGSLYSKPRPARLNFWECRCSSPLEKLYQSFSKSLPYHIHSLVQTLARPSVNFDQLLFLAVWSLWRVEHAVLWIHLNSNYFKAQHTSFIFSTSGSARHCILLSIQKLQ